MYALRLRAPRTFESVPDAPEPDPVAGQVTVRLSAAALCGSDLPKWRSTAYPRSGRIGFPIHERVGHMTNANGTDLQAGQRVLAMPADECGLAELYLADRDTVHPGAASHLTDAQATLIQPVATVLYATDKLGDVTGARVTVLGMGPIGLMCAYVLSQYGAQVTGVDPRRPQQRDHRRLRHHPPTPRPAGRRSRDSGSRGMVGPAVRDGRACPRSCPASSTRTTRPGLWPRASRGTRRRGSASCRVASGSAVEVRQGDRSRVR